MSKLFLANNQQNWQLNVTSFSSPLYGQLTSVQTKKMAHHYPIKCAQPEIKFSVQFSSETDYENFQKFVRAHQQGVLASTNLVWLNWPERNIDNWTGVIRQFKAGGMRRNFAPQASFTVDLVDSMLSHRTNLASLPQLLWQTIYGAGMGPGAVLAPPTAAELSQFFNNPFFSGGSINPSQPGLGLGGITAGN